MPLRSRPHPTYALPVSAGFSDDRCTMAPVLLALITTASGLIGVLLGGWLTSRNQKRERKISRFREQLGEFYGPMLAMRAEVLAKAELRLKISDAAAAEWHHLIGDAQQAGGRDMTLEVRKANFPVFEEIIKHNNRQFAEEIMPLYRKMVQCFLDKMQFAEVSTLGYLEELIVFVEIWNRWLADSIPGEVVERLGHSEEKLFPFYQDVASNFSALQAKVKEASESSRRRGRSGPVKVVPSR